MFCDLRFKKSLFKNYLNACQNIHEFLRFDILIFSFKSSLDNRKKKMQPKTLNMQVKREFKSQVW